MLDGLFYTANFSAQYETKTFNLNLRILTLPLEKSFTVYYNQSGALQ